MNIQKLISTLLFLTSSIAINAMILPNYSMFEIELKGELGEFFKQKDSTAKRIHSSNISIMLKNLADETPVRDALAKILTANQESIITLIKNPRDAKRAVKFLNMLTENPNPDAIFKVGKYVFVRFKPSKKSKIREGMNFFVFEESGNKYTWIPSFSDSIMQLTATAITPQKANLQGFPIISPISDSDKSICETLVKSNLPILCFQNVPLVSLDKIDAVEEHSASKFYHKAQESFFEFKFDDYANFMTPISSSTFKKQFEGLSDSERKNVLKEYVSWKKNYLKVMEAKPISIIVFERIKEDSPKQFDITYIGTTKEAVMKIFNFGATKSPLDIFLARYILKESPYLKNISAKFLK